MHPKTKGELTEQIVITELMKLGYKISRPVGDNLPYDLVIDHLDKFTRVQIRSARIKSGCVSFSMCSSRINYHKAYKKFYNGLCDLFVVYCWDNEKTYFFPVGEVPRYGASLRIATPKRNQIKGIRYAEKYHINNLSAYLERGRVEHPKFGESLDEATPSQAAVAEGVET